MSKPQPPNFQRARLLVIRSEAEIVLVTAVVTAEVVVQIRGDYDLQLEETIPAFFLAETDRILAVGTEDWDAALRRVGYGLVGIPFAEWGHATILAALRSTFPTIEGAAPDQSEASR